jgi:hypothetical protein
LENLKERVDMKSMRIDGKIKLQWILKEWDGRLWIGLIWLRIGTSGELL